MMTHIKKLAALLLALLMLTGTALADMRIANNMTSLNSHRNGTNDNSALTKNLENLSSGYRLNRAGDDAAGLATIELMQSLITGLTPAEESVQAGVSLVQTPEAALEETRSMLNNMVELSLQSESGDDSSSQKTNKELEALQQQVQQLADAAQSADSDLPSGLFSGAVDDSTLLTGIAYGTNVMALFTTHTGSGYAFSQVATDGSNAIIGSDNPKAILVSPNGDIGIVGAGEAYIGAFDGAGNPLGGWQVYTDGNDLYAEPGELEITLNGEAVTTLTLSVGETAQLSVREAQPPVAEDKAAEQEWQLVPAVSSFRSDLGIPQDRLEHTINNLTVPPAESSIRDRDVVEEMMAYTKNNILVQSSQNMLAQANMVPQGVMQLLQ